MILLVEDNPDDEELTLRALKKNNIDAPVVVARDGVEALDYVMNARELPRVVLLDLKLPKLDGLEVLRAVRADPRTKRLPIVILTSSAEHQDVLDGYDLGANSYIRKPVDFTTFVETVRQLGTYWLTINQPVPA